jgi:hypothetical protein
VSHLLSVFDSQVDKTQEKMFRFLRQWVEWISADELGLQPHHCQGSLDIQHPAVTTPDLQKYQAVAATSHHNEAQ